ncbi:hypothetical protein MTP99_015298 [Tenebrio molitor]|jgi:hypothetical protein|uniref:Protein YIPF n=1 Tax=Tenebrio molitor TaxID=7067 RepID=A0A8J6L732_TENMO|nr:hypothetical protein GEV33_012681 [Tenebrio molitor]KAJ3627965.1 hypothetical protein MTP99_015298 [Tenebrio molitor]CAH1373938.1 unnamed protein product [Tenebrio molitor]
MDDPLSFSDDFDTEPSLLEELEIYPDRIIEKIMVVLHPFRRPEHSLDAVHLTKNPDLAGPILFYLLLAVCSFLAGNKPHFGFVYGVSVISCFTMYGLLSLMTSHTVFDLTTVACILGYSLVPIVALSVFGIFYPLRSLVGVTLATSSVIWSSMSASRLFVTVSGRMEQQPLLAYPCALLAAMYVLTVMF